MFYWFKPFVVPLNSVPARPYVTLLSQGQVEKCVLDIEIHLASTLVIFQFSNGLNDERA